MTVLSGGAGYFGIPIGGVENGELTDALLQAVSAVAGLVAILGRVTAKDRIG